MPINTRLLRGDSFNQSPNIHIIPLFLGERSPGGLLQLRVWKNWFPFIRLLRKIPKTAASVFGYNSAILQFGSCNYLLYNIYIDHLYNIPLHLYLQYTIVFIQYSHVVICAMFFEMFIAPFPSLGNNKSLKQSKVWYSLLLCSGCCLSWTVCLWILHHLEHDLTRVYVSWLEHYTSASPCFLMWTKT